MSSRDDEGEAEDFNRTEAESSPLVSVLLERASSILDPAHASQMICEAARVHLDADEDFDAARSVLLDGLMKFPGSLTLADELFRLGVRSGDWAQTMSAFQNQIATATQKQPSLAGAFRLRLAGALLESGETHQAFDRLEDVREVDLDAARSILDLFETQLSELAHAIQIAEVCERLGDTERALRIMSRGVAMATSAVDKAHFYHYVAVLELAMQRRENAIWNFQQALLQDPGRRDSMTALVKIFGDLGQESEIAKLYERLRAVSQDSAYRSELACLAAQVYRDLGESSRSLDLYRSALDSEHVNVDAALPLLESYEREKRFDASLEILDKLRGDLSESGLRSLDYFRRAGVCYEALGRHSEAIEVLPTALEHHPENLQVLRALARSYLGLGMKDEAMATLNRARSTFSEQGASAETEGLFAEIAAAQSACGDSAQAIVTYRRALERGYDSRVLGKLTALLEATGQYREVIRSYDTHLGDMSSDEVVHACVSIATLAKERLDDISLAESIYNRGLLLVPGDRRLLQSLVEFHSAEQNWNEAIRYILLIADIERDVFRKAKYLQAASSVARNHGSQTDAARYADSAIDLYLGQSDPSMQSKGRESGFELFERLAVSLNEAGEHKELERFYRRMIKRLAPGDAQVANLWSRLGTLYKEHLGQRYSAISSFEVAATLDSDSLDHSRHLVALYESAGADHLDKAIERRYQLLRAETFDVEHYKALRSLFVRTRQYDLVWCVTRALSYFGAADESERAFYRKHVTADLSWPTHAMAAEDWALLRHSDENFAASRIFAKVCQLLALDCATPQKKFDLSDDVSTHFLTLRRLISTASQALGIGALDHRIQPYRSIKLSFANVADQGLLKPTLVMGQHAFEDRSLPSIAYDLSRFLTYAKPEYYLRWILSSDEDALQDAMRACVSLCRPDLVSPRQLSRASKRYRSLLDKAPLAALRQHLSGDVDAAFSTLTDFDSVTWRNSVDKTARRAGLLLCSDLKIACIETQQESTSVPSEGVNERIRDLLYHSVSLEHVTLRERLGLAIRLNTEV